MKRLTQIMGAAALAVGLSQPAKATNHYNYHSPIICSFINASTGRLVGQRGDHQTFYTQRDVEINAQRLRWTIQRRIRYSCIDNRTGAFFSGIY